MSSAETIQVTIFNQTYSLRSASGAEHVREMASLVDERMKRIASHLAAHDLSKIAILTALNIADEMQTLRLHYESEIERLLLLERSSVEQGAVEQQQQNPQLSESERASWFEDIFEADDEPPARDRAHRLSTQISAKLKGLRKNGTPEPGIEGIED